MTEPDTRNGRKPIFEHPHRAADIARHIVDAAAAPATFLLVEARWGPEWGALAALLAALMVAGVRRHRGDRLIVVAGSTVLVAFHSVSAIAFDEGRAFYIPEFVINGSGLVVCVASLLIGRPATEVVCRKIRLEPATTLGDPRARKRHRRLTAIWSALWVSHLVPFAYVYSMDSVAGLTLLGTFFNKPTLLLMVILTVVVVRRATRPLDGGTPLETRSRLQQPRN
ncbi:DUF3159 domain-containing protein [Streptomyces sp. NEAU-174]|uniref:DUF3159 domain-containing protein n=1 Tax=Streptomyces sp. NEAU-174 TaxID=3458254 RepID=UPI0040445377